MGLNYRSFRRGTDMRRLIGSALTLAVLGAG